MRIVLVNWARIRDGAMKGGGVNGYCQGLALELVRRGHEVVSLSGGVAYDPPGTRGVPPCRIHRHEDWLGVRVHEVINSPVLAPAIAQFLDPMGEVRAPDLERPVGDLLRDLAPDVVHFHNIEGFSAGCVDAALGLRRDRRGPVVLYSLHNYHTVCPQVYLMRAHRRACRAYENGHACATCVQGSEPGVERARRAGVRVEAVTSARTSAESRAHDPPLLTGMLRGPPWGRPDPDWDPLENDPTGEPPSDLPPNDFARRRSAMVAMLNRCDRVLAVSEFVRAKFEALGVRSDVLRTLHIGTRAGEIAADQPGAACPPPPTDPPRPLRAVFLGYHNRYKGLPMLADALELLTPEYLSRLHLSVYALGGEAIWPRYRRLEPRLAGLVFRHGYEPADIPWLVAAKDIGLVPSVWWDNGPQTVLEMQACGLPVLGARLGGIPDFVRHEHNGLLFRGNDRVDLARHLARLIDEPALAARLRAQVRPPPSMAEHAGELERLYVEPLS